MTTSPQTSKTVDVNVPRFNQGTIAVLTGIAFVLQLEWLVAVSFAILAFSWLVGPRFAPLTQLYVRAIRPLIGPPTEFEPIAPPRFAQLIGSIFLGAATVSFALELGVLGWVLSLIVTALAALAAVTRICVGCIIYEKAIAR